jgi:hypothetical protein
MGRLENEDGLGDSKKASRIEERMCGKKYERVEEDVGPDRGYKQEDSGLGEDACT